MFEALGEALKRQMAVGSIGFNVADSAFYRKWVDQQPDFETRGHSIVKEWEITARRSGKPDMEKLSRYERKLGGHAGLFGAIVADRRLFMGTDCTYSQDYDRRFTDDELLCILQAGLEELESVFDTLKPDILISFICVTMVDYLAYLFARSRGIKVLNLRPTRIGDRVTFSMTLNDPSPEFADRYHRILRGDTSPNRAEAVAYIKRVREHHGRYEGVVKPSNRPALKADTSRMLSYSGIKRAVTNYRTYRNTISFSDNHVPDPLRAMAFTALINPLRAKITSMYLRKKYITSEELKTSRYVFFPLHTEPEVSLLVYGRPYVNQIEIIRTLAMSLPVDMILVVKEHPWMVGKRTLGAYSKMLNIPRVRFAEPSLDARSLIQQSDLVAVVTGSIALEAAMLGKPVITFGDCPYNLLPETMIQRSTDIRHIQILIRNMLDTYLTDDLALEAYVSAVFDTSCGVNLYSVLLGKKNVHVESEGAYGSEIQKMADHVAGIINNSTDTAVQGAAIW
jgi:hypothetical protein